MGRPMRKDIHPAYYPKAKIKCACGHVFNVGATKETMSVEICSHCHPFYTGTEKLLDIAGRVEKFRTRQEAAKKRALAKPVAKKRVKAASSSKVKAKTSKRKATA